MLASLKKAGDQYLPVILMVSCIALLPFKRLVVVPMFFMLVGGVYQCYKKGLTLFQLKSIQLLTVLFLCYWLPILISTADSFHVEKSLTLSLAAVRFWFIGVFAICLINNQKNRHWIRLSITYLLLFWVVDAYFQLIMGFNLLGMPYAEDRLNGVFGNENYMLGPMVVLLLPIAAEHARRKWLKILQVGLFVAVMSLVLMIGTRSSWIMLAIIIASYLWLYSKHRPNKRIRLFSMTLVSMVVIVFLVYQASPFFQQRVERSLLIFHGDTEAIDEAVSNRISIWSTSLNMIEAHPINGVGARSFRYAYKDYAVRDDPWIDENDPIGAFHAHQLILEITAETGIIGLLGFLVAVIVGMRAWWHASTNQKVSMFPFTLGLLAMLFPINSHYALYSTFWSIVLWWFVIMFCVGANVGSRQKRLLN